MRNKKYFDTIVKSSLLLILKYLKDGNVVVILKDFSTPAHLIKYLCTLCRTKSSKSSFHENTTKILPPISFHVISILMKPFSEAYLIKIKVILRTRRLGIGMKLILIGF